MDSNVLFSALIKNSATRRIILEYDDFFLFPSYIFEEMEEHKPELMSKSGMHAEEFEMLLQILLKKVLVVPEEVLNIRKEEAVEIVKNIDPSDVVFVACALAYPESVIWSDDKDLKKQSKVRVLNTSQMIQFLE